MTVASITTKVIYAGNGATTTFPISFTYTNAEEIAVYKTDVSGVISLVTTNITIDIENDQVIYPVDTLLTPALATGTKLTIARDTPRLQEVDLTNSGYFNPTVIEQAFDKLTRLCQELDEKIGRAIRYNIDESTSETNSEAFILAITAARDEAVANQSATATNAVAAAASVVMATSEASASALSADEAAASVVAAAAILASGAAALAVSTKTTNYTLLNTDKFLRGDATSGNITLTLPTAIAASGLNFSIKKIDSTANTVTINTGLSQTIDGLSTYVLESQYETISVISSGTNWEIF